jgi:hypothetical protein
MGDELIHYGVKGMKWGVRKAHTGNLNKAASRLERVASGNGSLRDKIGAASTSSVYGLAKRGLKGNSAHRAEKIRAAEKRLATGKAKVGDILNAYGSANLITLALAAHKKSDHELPQ